MAHSDYYASEPNLPGNWKRGRVQRGHFGPFFEWINFGSVSAVDECPHCEGAGDIEVEVQSALGHRYSKSIYVDCPWCDGSGKAVNCDDLPDDMRVTFYGAAERIWCDAEGNRLDVETDLEGWPSWQWLQSYEPNNRIAA